MAIGKGDYPDGFDGETFEGLQRLGLTETSRYQEMAAELARLRGPVRPYIPQLGHTGGDAVIGFLGFLVGRG